MSAQDRSSADRLLEAGVEHVLYDGLDILTRGLNTADVTKRAGVSSKTFFHVFRTKKAFVDSLVELLVEAPQGYSTEFEEFIHNTITSSEGDIRRTVRAVCAWDFERVRKGPTMLGQLAVLVHAHGHREAMRAVRRAYRSFDDTGTKSYEAIIAKWGVSLRAPFSSELLAITLTAVVEGLALRSLVDPGAVSPDLFGNIVVALLGSLIDIDHKHEHIDDVLAPAAEEVMHRYQTSEKTSLPADPRRAILDAGREEFGERGYFLATLERIATRAGVPLPVLKNLFPSKEAIIVGALSGGVRDLGQQVADDNTLGLADREVVLRHLNRLAEFGAAHHEYIEALIAVVAHVTPRTAETTSSARSQLDIPSIIAPVIQAGQDRGTFRSSASAYDVAALLTNTLLLRLFTRRMADPAAQARLVGETFLDGLIEDSAAQ